MKLGSCEHPGLKFWLTLCAAWLACAAPAASLLQEYRITKWETDDGLPENSATAMAQTRDGYLWFGTFNGLVRFDGLKFTVFNPANTPELPSASIINLHVHKSGRLWISTDKGLVSLLDGQWKRQGLNTSWTNRYARTFAENADGVLCATSFDGAVCRNQGEDIIELPPPTVAKGQRGYVDPAGTIWAASAEFFGHWNGQRWVPSSLGAAPTNDIPSANIPATNWFRSSGPARDGGLWILGQSALLKLEGGRITRSVNLSRAAIDLWDLFEDQDGTLWASSYLRGLTRISPTTGAMDNFTMQDGLSYDALRFVFQDRERNLWVGTSGGGLMRLRPRTFQTYGTEDSLRTRVVKSVCEERPGVMLLGTYGGYLARMEGLGEVTRLEKQVATRNYVQCVLVDRQHRTWIGFDGESLVRLENNQHQAFGPVGEIPTNTFALFEDSAGRIWIGSHESVARFEQGKLQNVNGEGAALTDARYFAERPTDRSIWAVSGRGLFRFRDGQFQAVNGPGGKPIKEGNCLRFEADGTLWVGTRNAGLLRLSKQTWASLTSRDGLPSDSILSLLEDGQGFFWIGSNRGIARVAKAACHAVGDGRQTELGCQVFTVSDGLGSVECAGGNQPNATTDSQGRLWFATLKGVAVVDPRRIRVNTNPPPVLIEQVEYRDQTSDLHELAYHGQAQLVAPPGTRQFVVHFSAPAYSAPEKMKFRYTIDQPRGKWVEVSDRRWVVLPTPVPGTTHYRIKAANSDGVWNEIGVSLALTVPPFYWQTLWFRCLAALAALGLVGGTVWRVQHYKLSRQQEQFNQERALAHERAQLASVLEGTMDFVGFTSPNGSLLYINPAGRRLVGLTETEDVTQIKMHDLFLPASTALLQQTAIPEAIRTGTWSGETTLKGRDGKEIPVSQVIVAHRSTEGQLQFVSTILRDITERKRAEAVLRVSLAEKTTLLQEVHHRVKNNLQIVTSLLNLQAGQVQDAAVLELLAVTRSRVGAMALLHENLYQSPNLARLNLPAYVESLCAQLLRAAGPVHARVRLERSVESETVSLGLDQAVPCGLLLNELVTNALKHAFPGERSGCIRVTLERATPHSTRLSVTDDGVGLPVKLDPRHSAGLGLQLVFLLAQQLHGTVNFERGQGTAVHILFPNSAEKEMPHA